MNINVKNAIITRRSVRKFLPKEIKGTRFYTPGNNGKENNFRQYLKNLWKDKYGY